MKSILRGERYEAYSKIVTKSQWFSCLEFRAGPISFNWHASTDFATVFLMSWYHNNLFLNTFIIFCVTHQQIHIYNTSNIINNPDSKLQPSSVATPNHVTWPYPQKVDITIH